MLWYSKTEKSNTHMITVEDIPDFPVTENHPPIGHPRAKMMYDPNRALRYERTLEVVRAELMILEQINDTCLNGDDCTALADRLVKSTVFLNRIIDEALA